MKAQPATTSHDLSYEPVRDRLIFGRDPYRCTACRQRYRSEKAAGYYDCLAAQPACEHKEHHILDGDLVCADCQTLIVAEAPMTHAQRGGAPVTEPVGSPGDWYLTREERGY